MKGIVLAGGLGTRLKPITDVYNKHLVPVAGKPMIYYPLETLVNSGIEEIMIVTGGKRAGDFLELLKNGEDFNLKHIEYAYQKGEGGIAEALKLAEYFVAKDNSIVILGDNYFEDNIKESVQSFSNGAKIFLKEVSDPKRFGVAQLNGTKVLNIEEKPKNPKTNLAVTGLYIYDSMVFDIIKDLKPSKRGELEITDVNNEYIKLNNLHFEILKGFWSDMGTFESLKGITQYLWERK